MGQMKEFFDESRNDSMEDYMFAMEEMAYEKAVHELADFIRSGAVTEDQAFDKVREALHGQGH